MSDKDVFILMDDLCIDCQKKFKEAVLAKKPYKFCDKCQDVIEEKSKEPEEIFGYIKIYINQKGDKEC